MVVALSSLARLPVASAFTPIYRRAAAAALTTVPLASSLPLHISSTTLATTPLTHKAAGGAAAGARPPRYRRGGQQSPWTLPARSVKHHPIWEDAELSHIFENNKKWVEDALKEDPDFFKKLKSGQYLYIGCSDSRVPAQEIMGLKAGEVFVARNIANLVVNTDMSLLAVLEYAVHVLEVKDIFVVGHYQCGGIKAAMEDKDHGLLEHWLRNIRDVHRIHKEELDAITDAEAQWNRMVELNVQEQCINLFANPIVQRKQVEAGFPRIHGFVYDVGEGLLRKLDIDFKAEIKKNLAIYKLYDFKNSGILMKRALDEAEEQEEQEQQKKAATATAAAAGKKK